MEESRTQASEKIESLVFYRVTSGAIAEYRDCSKAYFVTFWNESNSEKVAVKVEMMNQRHKAKSELQYEPFFFSAAREPPPDVGPTFLILDSHCACQSRF